MSLRCRIGIHHRTKCPCGPLPEKFIEDGLTSGMPVGSGECPYRWKCDHCGKAKWVRL